MRESRDSLPTRLYSGTSRRHGRERGTAQSVPPEEDDATRIAPSRRSRSKGMDGPTRLADFAARTIGSARALRPGSLIKNRFRLEYELGRGGMGVVYAARDLLKEKFDDPESLIAIKLLSEDFKNYPDALRMLQQESRRAQELAHPNIITVYDFDRDGDLFYMTMELLKGAPLDDFLDDHEKAPASLDEVLPIISDIVHGLDYAHQQGVVHSDLKPANIFITEKGITKIVDFGIARAIMNSDIGGNAEKTTTGEEGRSGRQAGATEALIALTPSYASPEMFDGEPPDPRDDVYALGCITYLLLSGKHPYRKLPANKARDKGLAPERIDGLKDRQWHALELALELDRDERLPTAGELLEAFQPRRREPWKIVTGLVVVLAISAITYFILRVPPEAPLDESEKVALEQQLQVARESMEIGSLGIAFDNYKMILALPPYDKQPPGGGYVQHPYDRKAMQGLKALLDIFSEQAKQAIDEGRLDDARGFVEAGLSVPDPPSVFHRLQKKLQQSK